MATVRPFRALTYDRAVAGPLRDLVSPPYDVITSEEREGYLAASAHNAVRLILPETEYAEVAGLIARWVSEGVLARADEPLMIAWTQAFDLGDGVVRERRTILCAVGLEPYEKRIVRPHERTHAGPKEDRLRLTRAVRTNLSPVFSVYPDPEGAVWAAAAVSGEAEAELQDADGTLHRFWTIADPARCDAVSTALADRWLLIADGHHRYETALAYQTERRSTDGAHPGAPWNFVMMGLTALDDPGLVVLPTHRLLSEWREGCIDAFTATPVANPAELGAALAAADPGAPAFGLVRRDRCDLLTLPPSDDDSPGARLDVAVLEREVLLKGYGRDQAALAHDGVLTYTKDGAQAWERAQSGDIAAGFILRPLPKPDVAAVSEAGETMPQKSTYFFPKLLTGIAFHPLDDG